MKNPFFRSPVCILLLLITVVACRQTVKKHEPKEDLTAIKREISVSRNESASAKARSIAASRAVVLAKRDTTLAMASQNKLALLSAFYPDSTYRFLRDYRRTAIRKSDSLNIGIANDMLAEHFFSQRKTDSAFSYYEQSRAVSEARKDSMQVVYALLQMAEIYRQYNDYPALENITVEAENFLADASDTLYNPTIYNNFGIAAKNLGDYNDAIRYYRQTASITDDPVKELIAESNIAAVCKMTGNFEQAEKILLRLLKSPSISNDPKIKGRLLATLGHTRFLSGKPGAIAILHQSEHQRLLAADSLGLASSYNYLAEAYREKNRPKALQYGVDAYHLSTRQNSIDDRLYALKNLIRYSPSDAAKKFAGIYVRLDDSIVNVRQKAKNQFAKIRYDATAEKQENQRLKAAKAENAYKMARAELLTILLGAALLLLAAAVWIGYLITTRRHRIKIVRQGYLTETRIGKKVHDEFANDLYSTIAYTESEDLSHPANKEKLLQQLDNIYFRSRDIASQNSIIATDEKFPEQLRLMLSEFGSESCRVIIGGLIELAWQEIPPNQKIATYRVLQELMVNMKKHSIATLVGIRFEKAKRTVAISYTDNGVGFDRNRHSFNNGLVNVENRIHEINGTITFDSAPGKGLRILINYPLKRKYVQQNFSSRRSRQH